MYLPLKKIQWVEINEHSISHLKNVKIELFEIYSKGLEQSKGQLRKFNHPLYCKLLLEKVLNLNSVLLSRFLDYQCNLLTRPYSWLTSLNMLLEYNVDLLIELNLGKPLNGSLNLINEKRTEYQQVPRFYREDDFGNDNPYRFDSVKLQLDKLETYHKKKTYLLRVKSDYLQNQYNYDRVDGVDFDIQVNLELTFLDELQSMKNEDDFLLESKPLILIWEGQLNILVDFFYQCLNSKTERREIST